MRRGDTCTESGVTCVSVPVLATSDIDPDYMHEVNNTGPVVGSPDKLSTG